MDGQRVALVLGYLSRNRFDSYWRWSWWLWSFVFSALAAARLLLQEPHAASTFRKTVFRVQGCILQGCKSFASYALESLSRTGL